MQEDTYRGDGLNLYAYCANNPVVYYDPSGHMPQYAEGGVQGSGDTQGNQIVDNRQTPDQKALLDLAKEAERAAKNGNPISFGEAKILDEWAKEYNVKQHHPAIPDSGVHFPGGNNADHTHIYNIHVPYVYK